MLGVSITYNLTGAGWSECFVELGGQYAHLTASYLSDALGSLLDTVIGMMLGREETTASFEEEPGEYRWRFQRVQSDKVNVRILWFYDTYSRKPEEQGEMLLNVECRLRTFAGAALSAAQRVLAEYGLEGYREQWVMHEFPLEQQNQLKTLLERREQGDP